MNYYTEHPDTAKVYREEYVASINSYIDAMRKESVKKRDKFMSNFENNTDKLRDEYYRMIGLRDLVSNRGIESVEVVSVASDDLCAIDRIQLVTKNKIKTYGILMIPHKTVKAPLVIVSHGGGGTPELCSDMHGANNYNHIVRRWLKKGVIVFAPQLLLWNNNNDWKFAPVYNIPYNRSEIDKYLKQLGMSITALEISNIMIAIDYLQTRDDIDETKIAMTGVSYGGFFTLYTMAADKRIKCGYSCACFNDRIKYNLFDDWVWHNSANNMLDAEVAALCAPRGLYIDVGMQDPVFDYRFVDIEFKRASEYYKRSGTPEKLILNIWDGGHTVSSDDCGFEFVLNNLNS